MTTFTAHSTDQAVTELPRMADFAPCEAWQFAEIQAGITEADHRDFATMHDVAAVIGKYVNTNNIP